MSSHSLWRRRWGVECMRSNRVHRSWKGPEAPNGSQTRWGVVVKVELTRVKFWMIVVTWLPLREHSAPRVTLLHELYLILKIPPKLTADTICKSSVISEVCLEETLEFYPSDWSLFYKAMLILIPLLDYRTIQKQGGKRDAFRPIGPNNFKIVLIFLAKW